MKITSPFQCPDARANSQLQQHTRVNSVKCFTLVETTTLYRLTLTLSTSYLEYEIRDLKQRRKTDWAGQIFRFVSTVGTYFRKLVTSSLRQSQLSSWMFTIASVFQSRRGLLAGLLKVQLARQPCYKAAQRLGHSPIDHKEASRFANFPWTTWNYVLDYPQVIWFWKSQIGI